MPEDSVTIDVVATLRRAVSVLTEGVLLREAEQRVLAYSAEQGERIRELSVAADARVRAAASLSGPSLDPVVASLLSDAIAMRAQAAAIASGAPEEANSPADGLRFDRMANPALVAAIENLRRRERSMRGAVERRSLSRIRGTRWGRQGAIALALAWVIFMVGDWWLGPPNVAFHKPVLVSGNPTSPPAELVDGVTDKARPVIILGPSAAATIDLGGPYAIRNVRVFDRQDGGFDSNLPLSLETSLDGSAWSLWVRRRDHFSVWNERLHGARARYVRLRTDARDLALNEIEIYGSFER